MTRQGFVSTTDYEMDGSARPAFGGLLSDTFDEGKFGILVDADYTDKHQRRSEVRVSFRYGASQ